jgi:GGDEF domain-containing protein
MSVSGKKYSLTWFSLMMPIQDLNAHPLPWEFFSYLLEQEIKRAERYNHFFSVLRFHWDGLNLGDQQPTHIFSLVRAAIRNSDLIGFTQGEGLAVILIDADDQAVCEVVRRIRERLHKALKLDVNVQDMRIGWATFPSSGMTADELLD